MLDYRQKLKNIDGYADAFELVRSGVDGVFGMRRAGLNLMLQDMPSFIGAYHVLGSNAIVVNRHILAAIKTLAKSDEEYNSYLFVVLAHEYLHSLGIVDEPSVRKSTHELCRALFGEAHVATKMSTDDPASIYPELRNLITTKFGNQFELVKDFDRSNQSYIA